LFSWSWNVESSIAPPKESDQSGRIDVNIVGSFDWMLERKGDALLLGPATVYTHEGATRSNL
jgi:hypothetical protein